MFLDSWDTQAVYQLLSIACISTSYRGYSAKGRLCNQVYLYFYLSFEVILLMVNTHVNHWRCFNITPRQTEHNCD